MTLPLPLKKTYDEASVYAWQERIIKPWEKFFTKQELILGKEIYTNGEVRELELNEYDTIVHARFDQEECFALIEWSDRDFSVRGSSQDKVLCRALAVAGLYTIQSWGAKEEESLSLRNGPKEEVTNVPSLNLKKSPFTEATNLTAKKLFVAFETHKKGLIFKALWQENEKKLVPALKSEGYMPAETSGLEREKLIILANLARKGGFRFDAKKGYYIMTDIEKITHFLKKEFDTKWRSKFEFKLETGFVRLREGVQSVRIEIELEPCENGTFDFSWHMKVGDEVLDAESARLLIKKCGQVVLIPRVGLVRLSESKVELLATWRRWQTLFNDGKIPRYVLFSCFTDKSIKIILGNEIINWQKSLFNIKLPEIKNLPIFLRSYQVQGVKWLWHLCEKNCHGLLADEMGLGKTIQALSFIQARDVYSLPNLVVCPASVVPVWEAEVQRFFPDTKVEILRSSNDFYQRKEKTLWIASYAQLRMHKYLLEVTQFGYVILDEAQFIKNPDSKVSKACMRIRSNHRIVLSGTPLENRYLDLWTLFNFLMPGLLGLRKDFEKQIALEGANIGDRIKKQIAPFLLRRTKEDVLSELPDKSEFECICPLTDIQKNQYAHLTKEGVKLLGEDIPKAVRERSFSFLTLLTRLRQTCCDPALLPWLNPSLEASGKINVLVEKLREVLANKHKVVIFSQFVSFLKRIDTAISENFPDTPLYELTGKTLDRARPVETFQETDREAIMLVSLRAGGTGITLHSADYVFLMDPWWNPAVEEQAIDRVHRFGQDKPVFVYRMITPGTIESRIQKLKMEKKSIFSGILGGMKDISDIKNYFTSLSELIQLLPEN